MKHVRALLSLVASAAAVVALAAPAQAVVPDGSYTIRDVVTGQCLTPAGGGFTRVVLGDCTPWNVTAESDGRVRISETGGEGRCMVMSPIRIYPPLVDAVSCDFDAPKTWELEGEEGDVQIMHLANSPLCVTALGREARLLPCEEGPRFLFEAVG